MKKKILFTLLVLITIGLLSEAALRCVWGFAHAPLYQESKTYEYIVCPNQDGYRFGAHYHYNSFSQRSEEPDTTKLIVLGLGDSVIFGGVLTDQDSLATTLFTKETGIQMLNISAGSWGPDNCAAYLKEKGTFHAKAIYLIVSSHDAHDNINHKKVVGVHKSYPNKQYLCAWSELIDRYLLPKFFQKGKDLDPDQKVLNHTIKKDGVVFNPGFDQLKQIADSAEIKMYVCLHPEEEEIRNGFYNSEGEEIIAWCQQNGVVLIKELDEGISMNMLRDPIHPNEKGQRFEADLMKKYIKLN